MCVHLYIAGRHLVTVAPFLRPRAGSALEARLHGCLSSPETSRLTDEQDSKAAKPPEMRVDTAKYHSNLTSLGLATGAIRGTAGPLTGGQVGR